MTLREALDGFGHLLEICETAGIEPVEARFWIELLDSDERYNILLRLAHEGRSAPDLDDDTMTNVTLVLGALEQAGNECGFHVRRSMFYVLLSAAP